MKKTLFIILVALVIIKTTSSSAQEKGVATLGIGTGLEFGGIGGKLAYYPTGSLGLFGGFGYAIAGAGYNFGLQFLIPSTSNVRFYLEGMYGYNGIILIQDFYGYGQDFKEIYYGPSFGAGINIKNRKENYWQFSLLFPVRSKEFRDTWDAIVNNPYIETSTLLPFTITAGYNFNLN